jgi:hypothetical protein
VEYHYVGRVCNSAEFGHFLLKIKGWMSEVNIVMEEDLQYRPTRRHFNPTRLRTASNLSARLDRLQLPLDSDSPYFIYFDVAKLIHDCASIEQLCWKKSTVRVSGIKKDRNLALHFLSYYS